MLIKCLNIICIATIGADQLPAEYREYLKSHSPKWATPDGKEPFYPVSLFNGEPNEKNPKEITEVRLAILNFLDTLDCDYIQVID